MNKLMSKTALCPKEAEVKGPESGITEVAKATRQ